MYFEPVFLVEVGKQILVHRFAGQPTLIVLLVELQLGVINLFYYFPELLKSECFGGAVVCVDKVGVRLSAYLGYFVQSTFCPHLYRFNHANRLLLLLTVDGLKGLQYW